jgi:sarcosine oxidase subunit alpha
LRVDGRQLRVAEGISVAAAIAIAATVPRRRAPVCGMGVCFECRATVDGMEQLRTCLLLVAEGMEVVTHG